MKTTKLKVFKNMVFVSCSGTISATMGDNKASIDYFREAVDKARKNNSEHLPHYLVNHGMVQIQLVRKIECYKARNCWVYFSQSSMGTPPAM